MGRPSRAAEGASEEYGQLPPGPRRTEESESAAVGARVLTLEGAREGSKLPERALSLSGRPSTSARDRPARRSSGDGGGPDAWLLLARPDVDPFTRASVDGLADELCGYCDTRVGW